MDDSIVNKSLMFSDAQRNSSGIYVMSNYCCDNFLIKISSWHEQDLGVSILWKGWLDKRRCSWSVIWHLLHFIILWNNKIWMDAWSKLYIFSYCTNSQQNFKTQYRPGKWMIKLHEKISDVLWCPEIHFRHTWWKGAQ